MADQKKPQDRLPKKVPEPEPAEYFTFTGIDGCVYTAPNKASDVLSMGWVRKNRHLDEMDYVMTIVEMLIGDDQDVLAAWDAIPLGTPQFKDAQRAVADYIGATLGE